MKPIKIVMSAFGSYAAKSEISFENVSSGIFLIAGDTGSGKTTIFDAITYALYEQTSGGMRDGNMMRSQYASADTETYVELTFKYMGELYKIRRNPQYERPTKRKTAEGNGFTTESPKVMLTMPDGKEFIGNKTETNNKIVDIIGIDREQFTQIAMIAQGDFLRLLHANSDDRKRIFSKIFDTRIYYRIQESLKAKDKEINIELDKNKTLCEHEMNNIVCIDKSLYEDIWKGMVNKFEFKMDEILELLDKIELEIHEKEQSIKGEKEELEKRLSDINIDINSAQTVNSLFDKLNLANKIMLDLEQKSDVYNSKQKRLEIAKRAEKVKPEENKYNEKVKSLTEIKARIITINNWLEQNQPKFLELYSIVELCENQKKESEGNISQNIARITDSLVKYNELNEKKTLINKLEKGKNTLEKEITNIKRSIEDKKIIHQKLINEHNNLKNIYQVLADVQISVKDLEKKVGELDDLNKAASDLSLLKATYDISIDDASKALKYYTNKNNIYEEIYKEFLSEQAGILAKERLIENMPCPVCGSTNHPIKASLSEHAPTQVHVENSKKERDKADNDNNIAKENLNSAKQRYEMKLELVRDKAKVIIDSDFIVNDAGIKKINSSLEQCKHNLIFAKNELLTANKNKERFEEVGKLLDVVSDELAKKALLLEECSNNYSEAMLSYEKLAISIEELKKQLLFESREEAVEKINFYKSKLDALTKAVLSATNNYNVFSKTIESKKGQHLAEIENENRLEIELKSCKKLYFNLLKENNFDNEDDYKASKMKLEEIELLQNDIDIYNKKLSETIYEIDIYKDQTANKTPININDMLDKKKGLGEILSELEKNFKNIYALAKKDYDARKSIDELFKERKNIKLQNEIIKTLNKTANGGVNNNVKMDFETYIQRQYFNKIIGAANNRLVRMTSNQFMLQCRDISDLGNRGPVGLDLDIYSLVTDTTRDVKTLSGGESFMTALSMALGLADVIQSTAGAVHLDTMFIDEGFGSLDDASRLQAINVLNELAGNNRLVGIISHVNELKEQIDNRLIVKKSDKGSKVSWAE